MTHAFKVSDMQPCLTLDEVRTLWPNAIQAISMTNELFDEDLQRDYVFWLQDDQLHGVYTPMPRRVAWNGKEWQET